MRINSLFKLAGAVGLLVGLTSGYALAADPDAALAELANKVLSLGPNGESPQPEL